MPPSHIGEFPGKFATTTSPGTLFETSVPEVTRMIGVARTLVTSREAKQTMDQVSCMLNCSLTWWEDDVRKVRVSFGRKESKKRSKWEMRLKVRLLTTPASREIKPKMCRIGKTS